jgi:hypothetical protein
MTMTSQITLWTVASDACAAAIPEVRRRVELLERKAPTVMRRAHKAGAQLTYCGIAPLFQQPRAYAGNGTDWTIAPLTTLGDGAVMPVDAKRNLELLRAAGVVFPLVYIAHEISKTQLNLPAPVAGSSREPVALTEQQNAQFVGPIPLPAHQVEGSQRLDQAAGKVLHGLAKAAPVLGAIAVAPLLVAGTALSGTAHMLDPVIFGVQPAGRPLDGTPAAWFVLAAWDW